VKAAGGIGGGWRWRGWARRRESEEGGGTTAFLKMRVGGALVALRGGGRGEGRLGGLERNDHRWWTRICDAE